MKRRTEIIIEIEREIVITRRGSGLSWCINCGRQTQMLTAKDGAQFMKTTVQVIYRLAEFGNIHFTTTPDGLLLVCSDSLVALRNVEYAGSDQTHLIVEGQM